ncbi:MAG: TIGR04282 family arsenosugar biosynthesis glycosyltransferase [Gammaproteobacteria bacterium]
MKRAVVIVFARRPRAGRVKRRLAHAVGRRRATALYARTLARTLAVVDSLGGVERVLSVARADELAAFRHLRRAGWRLRPQRGRDLGARMADAMAEPLAGARATLLLGSDLRDITCADLQDALRALAGGTDIVFGAAADGGYWLVGMRTVCPAVFAGIAWSTPHVLGDSVARARAAGCSVAVLAPRHDLDAGRDLLRGAASRGFQRSRTWARSRAAT